MVSNKKQGVAENTGQNDQPIGVGGRQEVGDNPRVPGGDAPPLNASTPDRSSDPFEGKPELKKLIEPVKGILNSNVGQDLFVKPLEKTLTLPGVRRITKGVEKIGEFINHVVHHPTTKKVVDIGKQAIDAGKDVGGLISVLSNPEPIHEKVGFRPGSYEVAIVKAEAAAHSVMKANTPWESVGGWHDILKSIQVKRTDGHNPGNYNFTSGGAHWICVEDWILNDEIWEGAEKAPPRWGVTWTDTGRGPPIVISSQYSSALALTTDIKIGSVSSDIRPTMDLLYGNVAVNHAAAAGKDVQQGQGTSTSTLLSKILLYMASCSLVDASSDEWIWNEIFCPKKTDGTANHFLVGSYLPLSGQPIIGVLPDDAVVARCCTASEFVSIASGLATADANWGPEGWGIDTAIVPIRHKDLLDNVNNAFWACVSWNILSVNCLKLGD